MLIQIRVKSRRSAQIEVRDNVVIRATPSFMWAIGVDIYTVLHWVESKCRSWSEFYGEPSKLLQGLPSDSQIAKRVAP